MENDKAEEEVLDKEQKEIEKALVEITVDLTNEENWSKARKSLAESQNNLQKAQTLLNTLANKLQEEEKNKPKVDEIGKQIAIIEAELPEYRELDAKTEERDALQNKTEELAEELKKQREKCESLKKKKEDLSEERKTLEKADKEKAEFESQKKNEENRRKTVESISKELIELDSLKKQLKDDQKSYSDSSEDADKKGAEYQRLFKLYLDEQAGIIAERLVSGKPCPVCGSTTHPSKAIKAENAPTKEELDKSKDTYESAQKRALEASERAAKVKGQTDEKNTAVLRMLAEMFGDVTVDDADGLIKNKIAEIDASLKDIQNMIDERQKKIERRNEIDELILKEKGRLEVLIGSIGENEITLSGNTATLLSLKTRIEELVKKLKYESKKKAEDAKKALQGEQKALEDAYKAADDAVKLQNEKIAGFNAAINEAKKILIEEKEIDVDSMKEQQQKLNRRKEEIEKKKKVITARVSANESAKDGIKAKSKDVCRAEAKWSWVKALSNTANGNISGKEKIMLETYIQMTYFDRIIARANTRLMVMSGGQYELIRRKEAENNRSQSGLELDVIDHYNGTERSVKTLSGGESFKASLSLALGLSDEIQSSAGGIKLDTMFVDEGFGSLDGESLDQAMRVLQNLTEGNRLVGIISHVIELKDRIDKQIVVTKEKSGGSTIRIIGE